MNPVRIVVLAATVGWAVVRGVEEAAGVWVERATRPDGVPRRKIRRWRNRCL